MSAGGSFNPSANPSGGPIDNQQRLQTSPNPSLPPADYSMGYARNFQPPSFFNPFSGYYGANTGMGGFQQPQYGGFQQPQYGGFGGFGGFGGLQQPQYGGFQQPQYGGFQQPFGGGFQQPFMPQPPQMPPDFGGGFGLRQGVMPPPRPYDPSSQMATILPQRLPDDIQFLPQPQPNQPDYGNMGGNGVGMGAYGGGGVQMGPSEQTGVKYVPDEINNERDRANAIGSRSARNPGSITKDELAFLIDYESRKAPVQVNSNFRPQTNMSGGMSGGMGGYGGFNPMMGGGIGAFGGFQQQFNPYGNAYAPQIQRQPRFDLLRDNPSVNMTGFRKTADGKWERDPDYLAQMTPLST